MYTKPWIVKKCCWLLFSVHIISTIASGKEIKCSASANYITDFCMVTGYNSNLSFGVDTLHSTYRKHLIIHLKFVKSFAVNIPKWIFTEMTNLQTLDLSNSHVSKISQSTFTDAYYLQILNLTENNLTDLHSLTFDGADNLICIDLSYNKLNQISDGLFLNLHHLKKIDLSHNLIQTLSGIDLFANSLNELILHHNQLKNFTLRNTTDIDTVNLNSNQLEILEIHSRVRSLYVENNRLETQHFHLSSNLGILSLSNNWITDLNFIKIISNLVHLDLSINPLNYNNVDRDVFTKLINLKKLNFKSVNLNQFDMNFLSELRNLEVLDISYNNLDSIDFDKLSNLENLKELQINNNNLNSLTINEFHYLFPNLKLIDISENNWQCPSLKQVLGKSKLLNIQVQIENVNIATTNETNIRGIRCLNSINLSDASLLQDTHNDAHELSNNVSKTDAVIEILKISHRLDELLSSNQSSFHNVNQTSPYLPDEKLDNNSYIANEILQISDSFNQILKNLSCFDSVNLTDFYHFDYVKSQTNFSNLDVSNMIINISKKLNLISDHVLHSNNTDEFKRKNMELETDINCLWIVIGVVFLLFLVTLILYFCK